MFAEKEMLSGKLEVKSKRDYSKFRNNYKVISS